MPALGRGVRRNVSMKRFMALLKKNKNKDPPQAKLLDLAGQLCCNLQSMSSSLEKLVEAMMGCKLQEYFLTNINVVRAYVLVHIHRGQHDTACRLLECCRAKEKKELVQLWNEIHYHKVMEKHHTDSLTPVQKFRCRKRNPPPVSLCPEGIKNRNYPEKVRQKLHRFAANVTMNPNKDQREGLAQDMNLQPNQVYNWFANYRRRQKTRLSRLEKLINSTDEEPSTHQAKHQPDSGSCISQTADAFHAGIGSEQKEITLVPCGPGWEQSAAGLDWSAAGTFSKLLESSFLQSSELQEVRSTKTSVTPLNTEEPTAFCTKAEHGISLSSSTMETRQLSSYTATSPWLENFLLCSCRSFPFQTEYLNATQPTLSAEGVYGESSPGTAAGVRASVSKVPRGGCIEASSESISHQADLEIESFMLREGQLGPLETILPHSSPQTVLGKSQCPPVSTSHLEEIQALGHSQVLENPLSDPMTSDTFWAAWLLFEFSVGGRM
ncbi:anomalous homeobox protein isoform X5 [Dermochelys coriacea]|uniref:anomalous homeobox protein isoform X5 n=1 Tax=Dermochelys coriacea TaxID=27794 RepID=UPI001CA81C70|nr:anomalous homeobox protein isoform X5 [Dermochelys coriacea]